jgi:hypothetical protein
MLEMVRVKGVPAAMTVEMLVREYVIPVRVQPTP